MHFSIVWAILTKLFHFWWYDSSGNACDKCRVQAFHAIALIVILNFKTCTCKHFAGVLGPVYSSHTRPIHQSGYNCLQLFCIIALAEG